MILPLIEIGIAIGIGIGIGIEIGTQPSGWTFQKRRSTVPSPIL